MEELGALGGGWGGEVAREGLWSVVRRAKGAPRGLEKHTREEHLQNPTQNRYVGIKHCKLSNSFAGNAYSLRPRGWRGGTTKKNNTDSREGERRGGGTGKGKGCKERGQAGRPGKREGRGRKEGRKTYMSGKNIVN